MESTEFFTVTLNIKVIENDKLKVYYIENIGQEYTEEKKVEINVKGSEEFQNFNFSIEGVPYKFRIDLGENGNETQVWISEIHLKYKGREIFVDKSIIHRLFNPNVYLQQTKKGWIRKSKDKRYDPFIESSALLQKRMELEFSYLR